MAVETAADGAEALMLLNGLPFDVVVLDLVMLHVDGVQVLQELKSRKSKPRILVLSARDQVQDRVDALISAPMTTSRQALCLRRVTGPAYGSFQAPLRRGVPCSHARTPATWNTAARLARVDDGAPTR